MRFVPVPLLASAMVGLQELSTCPNITEIYVQPAGDWWFFTFFNIYWWLTFFLLSVFFLPKKNRGVCMRQRPSWDEFGGSYVASPLGTLSRHHVDLPGWAPPKPHDGLTVLACIYNLYSLVKKKKYIYILCICDFWENRTRLEHHSLQKQANLWVNLERRSLSATTGRTPLPYLAGLLPLGSFWRRCPCDLSTGELGRWWWWWHGW